MPAILKFDIDQIPKRTGRGMRFRSQTGVLTLSVLDDSRKIACLRSLS